ncbi:MAG: hypothetical protein KAY50_09795 [Chitinophagaceae bacterium]|nr:hypothetical protein [Chitinophagaceae bacterium]
MTLIPIGLDTQLENVLFGQSNAEKLEVKEKASLISANINKVHKVNGKKVYLPSVHDDDIFYFLEKPPSWYKVTEETKGNYYYPIQYAKIEFYEKNN